MRKGDEVDNDCDGSTDEEDCDGKGKNRKIYLFSFNVGMKYLSGYAKLVLKNLSSTNNFAYLASIYILCLPGQCCQHSATTSITPMFSWILHPLNKQIHGIIVHCI